MQSLISRNYKLFISVYTRWLKQLKTQRTLRPRRTTPILIEDAIELNKQSVIVRERLKAIIAEIDAKKKVGSDLVDLSILQ
jgi:hypothetical protein